MGRTITIKRVTVTELEATIPDSCPECDESLLPAGAIKGSFLDDVEEPVALLHELKRLGDFLTPDASHLYMLQCSECGHVLAGDLPEGG
jgi:hypothetical protein